MSILANNLKLLRKEANLSLEELSEKTGISANILEGFETDQFIPNDYQLEVLCHVLLMPFEDIKTRDLETERRNATSMMKEKGNRNNYNWYFGNKRNFILFLSYIIFFIIAMTVVGIMIYLTCISKTFTTNWQLLKTDMDQIDKITLFFNLMRYIFQNIYIVLTAIGVIDVVFFCLHYFAYHTFTFRIWYIFLFSFFLAMLPFIGLIGSWIMFIYYLVRLIKGKY